MSDNVPVRVFGLGTVEARVLSKVGFEVGAAVTELNADHGDMVKQGTVLARLHTTQQDAKVARAKAAVLSAEAAIKKAEVNVTKTRAILAQRLTANRRKQQLVESRVTSPQLAEEAQRDEDVAKADVSVAESDIEVAKAQLSDARSQYDYEKAILDQHTLVAPFDALVIERHKELGTVIKAGDPIFTLIAAGSVWALAYVDESRAGAIKEGQPAEVRLRSLPQQVFLAKVVRIGLESDRVSEERRVYVKCDVCPVRFHLGEQAEVLIQVATLEKATLVPEAAVTGFDGSKGTVWTVEERALGAPSGVIRPSHAGFAAADRCRPARWRACCQRDQRRIAGRPIRADRGGDQAMNLAYRDVRHNLFRFLLTCFGLSLLLSVVLAMIGIYRGIVVDALTVARNHRVDLWVVEAGSRGPFAEASRIPGDSREAIARLAGVTDAGSVTYQSVEAEHLGRKIRLYVIGFEPGRPGGPEHIASGRAIGQSHFEMVADRGTGLSIGDRIKLGRTTFSVVGLTENQVASSGDPVAFITLLDAQKLQFDLAPPATRVQTARGTAGASKDTVNAVVARIAPEANADTVAEAARRWKHLSAMTQAEQESILTQSLVDRARRQIGMFTSILLLVSAVIIALIIYTMTMEKLRQIAMLKLIGAPDRTIVAMIVQQALALGLTGFMFGALLIANIKGYFPRRVVLEPDNVLALGGVVFIVCILASGLGVRAALKADPATALGG